MAKSKSNFPEKIYVSGYPISIKLVKEIPPEYNMPKNTIGISDSVNKVIYIVKQKNQLQNFGILFHEVIHIICDLLYIKLKERDVHAFAFTCLPVLAQLEEYFAFKDLMKAV